MSEQLENGSVPRDISHAIRAKMTKVFCVTRSHSDDTSEDPNGNSQSFEYNPRFPGRDFDKETNLQYNYFR
ncbi:MAG: hypothetical protein JSR32_07210 [Proteobacteria bacterium]|nr:hypothetical protein [Pseudomonadota bacterium]